MVNSWCIYLSYSANLKFFHKFCTCCDRCIGNSCITVAKKVSGTLSELHIQSFSPPKNSNKDESYKIETTQTQTQSLNNKSHAMPVMGNIAPRQLTEEQKEFHNTYTATDNLNLSSVTNMPNSINSNPMT